MKDPLLDRILQSKWFTFSLVCFTVFFSLAGFWYFIKGLFTGVVYFQYRDSPELYIPWASHPQVYLVVMFVYFFVV